MTILEALKRQDEDVRIIYLNKWIIFYDNEWVVYERRYNAKKSLIIYSGADESEAVKYLFKED